MYLNQGDKTDFDQVLKRGTPGKKFKPGKNRKPKSEKICEPNFSSKPKSGEKLNHVSNYYCDGSYYV